MKKLELKRVSRMEHATFGVLLDGDEPFAVTLELPWRDNQRNVSCIPQGRYTCQRVQSPTFGDTYEVLDVKGRSHILFHSGNTASHTEGCIIVGSKFTIFHGEMGVGESRVALGEFMRRVQDSSTFDLQIIG